MVLDGGNRYRACIDLGLELATHEFDGANLVAFVLSVNLHRRHMRPGQQAAIVASAQDCGQAKIRDDNRKTDQSQTFDFGSES